MLCFKLLVGKHASQWQEQKTTDIVYRSDQSKFIAIVTMNVELKKKLFKNDVVFLVMTENCFRLIFLEFKTSFQTLKIPQILLISF